MAHNYTFPFPAVEMEVYSGDRVLYPLLIPQVAWINSSCPGLVGSFEKSFEKSYVERGNYLEILRYLLPENLQIHPLTVTLQEPGEAELYKELDLRYDLIYTTLPSGIFLGFVPALAIESTGKDLEDLKNKARENIKLEFTRSERWKNLSLILPTQWYREVQLHSSPCSITFYTLKELDEINQAKKKTLLPEVATKMEVREPAAFGLEEELGQMARALQGQYRTSMVILGGNGTGKTALIQEFCRRKREFLGKDAPEIWETTASQLVQKLTALGGWQEGLSRICKELREQGDLLYVRNLMNLFEVGQYIGNNVSMAEYLREYLQRGEIILLSECTEEESAGIELRSQGYLSLFQTLHLKTLSPENLKEVIQEKIDLSAHREKLSLTRDALEEALSLQKRYMPYSGFPGKTIRFLESLILREKKNPDRGKDKTITEEEVRKAFCIESGMPEFMINPALPLPLQEVKEKFSRQVFGQARAVREVANLLSSIKATLTRPGKPIASLLFVGPTGVGKTELAKVLAEFMFGSRQRMTRFDMSEFSDPYSVIRLTGGGFYREGILTASVRKEPFSVLLFDELEKAHYSFFDLLLQILGEGRLTDARGRVADFCSTIIIMTSNLGARSYQSNSIGFDEGEKDPAQVVDHFQQAAQDFFRPELFNRLDQVIPFISLDRNTIRSIARREYEKILLWEGIRSREMEMKITDESLDTLASKGYDFRYGARHMQRTFREDLLIPLSKKLNLYTVETPLSVQISLKKGEIQIQVQGSRERPRAYRETEGHQSPYAVVEELTLHRRKIQRLLEGDLYTRLLSERDIVRIKKRRLKKKIWVDPALLQRESLLGRILDLSKELLREIEDFETEGTLSFLAIQEAGKDLLENFEIWRESFRQIRIDIYSTLVPDHSICTLGLYGLWDTLSEVISRYKKLALAKGFSCRGNFVCHSKDQSRQGLLKKEIVELNLGNRTLNGLKNAGIETLGQVLQLTEEELRNLPKLGATSIRRIMDALADLGLQVGHADVSYVKTPLEKERELPSGSGDFVGVEMEFKGPGAFVYFGGESGFHLFLAREYKDMYFAEANPIKIDQWLTPAEVHRKHFFQDRRERRVWGKEEWKDDLYDLTGIAEPTIESLEKVLDQRFERELDLLLGIEYTPPHAPLPSPRGRGRGCSIFIKKRAWFILR